MRCFLGLLCVCSVPLAGCSEPAGRACQTRDDCDDRRECSDDFCEDGICRHHTVRCPCEAILTDYCVGSECPTSDESVANAEEFAAAHSCREVTAGAGRCGDCRYVWSGYLFGPVTYEYYDAAATLVVVRICSETNEFCGRSALCIEYQQVPDCEREPAEDFFAAAR